MKKVKRLIEIKRQLALADSRIMRADRKRERLVEERKKIVASFTENELRLYKEKIERACK